MNQRHGLDGINWYYGWLCLSVSKRDIKAVVKDFAYNQTPNECITAGEGIPNTNCIDNYEPNNASSQATPIQGNQKVNALIGEPGDHDWFQFTPSVDKNNIRVVLKNLSANYNIKLLDQNLQTLGVSKHSAKTNDTIIYNNLDPSQYYYVVVKGQNADAFNTTDCYTLKVEARSQPYKLIDTSASQEEFTEAEIFPNPSSGKIYISGLNENLISSEVSVYDLSGRKIFSRQISSPENSFDISALAEGMYLLELKNETEVLVKKLEVKR